MTLHPLSLTFRDPALEQAWWAYNAAERGALQRGAVVLLLCVIAGFAVVDVLAFPSVAVRLLTIRALVLLLVSPPSIWLLLGRNDGGARLARWGQRILAYLGVVSLGGMLPMGLTIASQATDQELRLAVPCLLFALMALYGVSGIRFTYAAPMGLLTVAGYFYVLWPLIAHDTSISVMTVVFALASTVIGLMVSWSMERFARRDFVRRRELEAERRRSEALLRNIVPDSLALRLESGLGPLLERLSDVTVVFATLVGFDALTSELEPLKAVALLDRIVARFDALTREHGVERIKTVGATYMAAAGVPAMRPDHAEAAARLALAMQSAVRQLATAEGHALELRVGIASGPVLAGVIGRTRYAFDLWGDTANVASRLETHGMTGRIQVSAATARLLGAAGFALEERGRVVVKGKGELHTWWLVG